MYRETFQLDLSRYQEQSERRDRITSGKMVTGWLRSDEQLAREVEEVRARQGVVLSTLEEEAVSLVSLGAEVEELVGSEEDGELAGLVERSLGVLSGLRRERSGSRLDSTGRPIAQLLVRMLRRRDDRLSSLGSVLARLTHCLSSLTLLTKDIAQADSEPALDLALVEQKIELNKIFIQGNTGNTSYPSNKLKLKLLNTQYSP